MSGEDLRLPRYGDLVIRGTTLDEIAPLLDELLDQPWSRAEEIEESWVDRGTGGGQPLVFRRDSDDTLPGAHLYLFPREDGSLYVSNVVPTQSSQLTESEYNALLEEFHGTVVEAAVDRVGAEAELDVADYVLAERAGPEVADSLRAFSAMANKSTGASHPMDADRFDDFMIAASRLDGSRRPSADRIAQWLITDGWPEDTAWDLAIQYEQGLRLLDRFASRA